MNLTANTFKITTAIIAIALTIFTSCKDEEDPIKPNSVNLSSEIGENGKDVILSWTKPDNANGDYIYKITNADTLITELAELTYTVTGLEYNTEYLFQLIAISDANIASDTSETTIKTDPYGDGVFITNEGAFGNNNGSISFYRYKTDLVVNNVFNTINGRALGDVVQSMKLHNDRAYIVVNNSNKIEVTNRYSQKELGVIEGISSPRYFEANENKGYVSCWGDNSVKIIDLSTLKVTKSINVGSGPERLAISGGKLFVANSGGYSNDSTISVIDLETEKVTSTISVKYNPKSVVADNKGNVWALAHGKVIYNSDWSQIIEETPSIVYQIKVSDNSVVAKETLFDNQHPSVLAINNNASILFIGGGFGFGGVYKLNTDEVGGSSSAIKIIDDYAYGFAYDKSSEVLFVGIAPDFTSAGKINRYSETGGHLGEYQVGIGPNGAGLKHTK
jgi:YVTN family beta-propeller protein